MPRRKSINEFPGYVRISQPDYEVLSALVKKAVGDRSLAEFSEATGISPSTISRIINNKFASPSSDSVIARIIENIDPNSGVTREDILTAHGLAPLLLSGNMGSGKSSVINALLESEGTAAVKDAIESSVRAGGHASVKEKVFQEAVQSALLQKGYTITLIKRQDIISAGDVHYRADFAFKTDALKDHGIELWAFDTVETARRPLLHKLSWVFGTAYVQPLRSRGIKMSLIMDDRDEFEDTKRRFEGITIPDDISVILVDMTDGSIADEFQLAMTDGGNYDSVLL